MAKGTSQNGHSRLDEAFTNLAVAQTNLVAAQATLTAQLADSERHHQQFEREMNERVSRIEGQFQEIVRILTDHNRRIDQLTEAVRDKIGFKG